MRTVIKEDVEIGGVGGIVRFVGAVHVVDGEHFRRGGGYMRLGDGRVDDDPYAVGFVAILG